MTQTPKPVPKRPVEAPSEKKSKEELQSQVERIKTQIQALDQRMFAAGGVNLGWEKEEHSEFLAILGRWDVHLRLHSRDIGEYSGRLIQAQTQPKWSSCALSCRR